MLITLGSVDLCRRGVKGCGDEGDGRGRCRRCGLPGGHLRAEDG